MSNNIVNRGNGFPSPGSWQQFCIREDNKQLTDAQRKQKFLKEQALYNKYRAPTIRKTRSGGSGGGGGGVAIDGPLSGAVVQSNVGATSTDGGGKFVLPGFASGTITVTGGTDAITGLPFEGELIGDAQYKTISPITTFAHYLKEASAENSKTPTLTIDEAITKTFTDSFDYFGISLPIEDKDIILQKDYIEDSILNNNKIGISAQAVATQIEAIAETVGVALDGSQQAAAATKAGTSMAEFSEKNRKRSAYRALGRQANKSLSIEVGLILEEVKYIDPVKGTEQSGVSFDNGKVLSEQLEATKTELIALAKQEQYTTNYLTTRIQAVNRAQKTVIKNEVKTTVETAKATFSNIETVSNSNAVKDALKQIEKDKANEKTPQLDGAEFSIPLGKNTKFKQLRKNAKSGTKELLELTIPADEGVEEYHYFGNAKDMPLILKEYEASYLVQEFPGTTGQAETGSIVPDTPLFIEVTSSTAAADIVTTYTLQPTIASKSGAGKKVTLRLTRIDEKKTEKVIDHIVLSSGGTYAAIYTKDSDKGNPINYNASASESKGGNILTMSPAIKDKSLPQFSLGRYLGAEPATLLALTEGMKLGGLNIQNLVFKDKKLSISIPATGEIEKSTLDITFTLK